MLYFIIGAAAGYFLYTSSIAMRAPVRHQDIEDRVDFPIPNHIFQNTSNTLQKRGTTQMDNAAFPLHRSPSENSVDAVHRIHRAHVAHTNALKAKAQSTVARTYDHVQLPAGQTSTQITNTKSAGAQRMKRNVNRERTVEPVLPPTDSTVDKNDQ